MKLKDALITIDNTDIGAVHMPTDIDDSELAVSSSAAAAAFSLFPAPLIHCEERQSMRERLRDPTPALPQSSLAAFSRSSDANELDRRRRRRRTIDSRGMWRTAAAAGVGRWAASGMLTKPRRVSSPPRLMSR